MLDELTSLIVDNIVGLVSDHYASGLSDYIHDAQDTRKRKEELHKRILALLQKEKEAYYFHEFDRLISNTKIIEMTMSGDCLFSTQKAYRARLEDAIEKLKIDPNYSSGVKNLMLQIYDAASEVFKAPASNEETRDAARLLDQTEELKATMTQLHEKEMRQLSKSESKSKRNAQNKLTSYISGAQISAKAFGLLPVLNETIPFEKAFPDLFVPPELHFEKQTLSYDEFLKQYSDKNLVILGDAGSGKSTLLKFISQFENVHAVYFTAQALKDNDDILKTIEQLYSDSHEDHLFLLVDSLDEAYWNDMSSYKKLINTLTRTGNAVNVWLASRKDFYQRTYSESTTITFNIAELWPWKDEYSIFLDNWAKVFQHKKTPVTIKNWAAKEPAVKEMLTNPFQLTLLAYLADTSDDLDPMTTIYDLYDKFFLQWFKKEELRGTGATNRATTISQLHDAANNIYAGKEYTTSQLNDTAVTNLLIWNSEEMDLYGNKTASMFRHHSLAAFLIAHQIMHAIQRGDNSELTKMLQMVIKDDVTNFVIRKAEQMKSSDIKIMRNHLASYYKTLPPNDKGYVNVKEKVIYYISRFPGDSSSFLLPIVRTAPENPYMRLTLAYACSLSEEKELRYYALEYARSLSHNEEDARVNRGWTVVYFGDCNKDPYTYRDEENGPWANARAARIKRFTKKKPRIKDYRFWLFDLPLFHTFLKSRNWADINSTEFEIIKKLTFPKDRFTPAEIRFLWREKKAILKTYEIMLKKTPEKPQEE